MSLIAGTRFGPYEILSALGAGGMGEVYRARDTRLDRTVAIKVLPTQFADDPQFRDRFEREAKAIAALTHPYICTLYDVGHQDATEYLVMEYFEGETLESRLKKGALPLDQALTTASQIASALDRAHHGGIVHRDLKPGNIMLTKGGAKLLDFGLAKASPAKAGLYVPAGYVPAGDRGVRLQPDGSMFPTTPPNLTVQGAILGTFQYMAPEQLEGQEADARTDIFAFGAVFYEMLTGKKAFEGKTQASLIGAIMHAEPLPISSLQRLTPTALDRLVKVCLAQDPDDRWQSARDLKAELEWIGAGGSGISLASRSQVLSRRSAMLWIVGSVSALASGSLAAAWLRPSGRSVDQALVKLDIDLGAAVSPSNAGADAILSPDGKRVVFVSQGSDGQSHLSTRRLDQAKAAEIANTEGAFGPFFSPDGLWIGFFSHGKLKKLPVEGGDAVSLCNAPAGRGATWCPDGTIIAALETRVGLSRVPDRGGTPSPFTQLDFGGPAASHRWPQVLPNGKAVLFTTSSVSGNFSESSVGMAFLADGRTKMVLERVGPFPHYLSSGHLTYVSKGTLFAVPFDLEAMELPVNPKPVPVLEGIVSDDAFGFAQFDASRDGSALFRSGKAAALWTLKWMDSAGKTTPVRAMPAVYQSPRLSPDSKMLAFTVAEGSTSDIWVYDLHRDIPVKVTKGQGVAQFAGWSVDSAYVIFGSTGGMFWTRPDGGGTPRSLTHGSNQRPGNFTPDGKRLVYSEFNSDGGSDIKTVLIESDSSGLRAGEPEPFFSTPSSSPYPMFSPDGKWIAYSSTESGVYEVYVRAFPNDGQRPQVSTAGGVMPFWSRNGELFYRTEDQRIMVASYSVKNGGFQSEKARIWSNSQLANSGQTINLDLASDGKRFVVVMPAEGQEPQESRNHVTLLLNFSDEIRRRLANR